MARQRADSVSPATLQILLSLVTGPLHGYGIKLDVEERTEGAISLGSGTLYQALGRLEDQGLIASNEASPEGDARRGRSYALTDAGRQLVRHQLAVLERTMASEAARAALAETR